MRVVFPQAQAGDDPGRPHAAVTGPAFLGTEATSGPTNSLLPGSLQPFPLSPMQLPSDQSVQAHTWLWAARLSQELPAQFFVLWEGQGLAQTG